MEERKAQRLIKEAAKRNDLASARILAKEVVTIRKTIERVAVNRANALSLSSAVAQQASMARVGGAMEKSTAVMQAMNEAVKAPQMAATVQAMSKEMFKAGMLQEMVDDALDSAVDASTDDEEVQEEVNKILDQIAGDRVAAMPNARRARAGVAAATPAQAAPAQAEDEDDELAAIQARLAAVKG